MRVSIITAGNEILNGQVLDTNSHYIHKRIRQFALYCIKSVCIPDDINLIVREIETALRESDICFISGGLGPTEDDRTVEAISQATSLPLVHNEEELKKLEIKLKPKGLPMSHNNLKQVFLPPSAEALDNPLGTAPGFYLLFQEKHIFCLPGVPSELMYIFENHIEPMLERLAKRVNLQSHYIIKTMGLSESRLSEIISASGIVKDYQWGMTAGYEGVFTTIYLKDALSPEKETEWFRNQFTALVGPEHIYGYNNDTLPEIIKNIAFNKKCTLAVAESCTGGFLGKLITDISGRSSYFKGGIIAYSNDIKEQILKVKTETLQNYGAVSVECAQEMAEGALRIFESDYSVSLTGIAGPGGGTKEKPVGTVCFAIAHRKGKTTTYKRVFFGTRDDVRKKSAYNALNYIRLTFLSDT
jgi:nicotinamide-nucleotide amidase